MTEEEVQAVRRENKVTVMDGHDICPKPVSSFQLAALLPALEKKLMGDFRRPTPVQVQSWPIAMQGHDMVAIAETGSGKTLGFLVPAFVHVIVQPPLAPGDGPICFILSPTRELAIQIAEEAENFGEVLKIRSVCCYGGIGGSKGPQMEQLRHGREICVACPGRMKDLLQSGTPDNGCNTRRVTYFVLDEADRLLDAGFAPQIREIVRQIRPDRQTLMWSATWSSEVQRLAREVFKSGSKPIHIEIGNANKYKVIDRINQEFMPLSMETLYERLTLLTELLEQMAGKKFLVFCERKTDADEACTTLRKKGISSLGLHGDKQQFEREEAFRQFRKGQLEVLVTTDVCARGIDVSNIDIVVNMTFPKDMDTYMHRMGRTGRAGKAGRVISLMSRTDARNHLSNLEDLFITNNAPMPQSLRSLRGCR
eukprot:GHVS01038904.1.p1 GENE.GHVS01038904.1~~GHVS01038904.1.p1  ORF type:complete len:462 (+),score=55.72 GHVS01038904.1:115-1386(+)